MSGRGGELAGIGMLPGVGDSEPCSTVGVDTSLEDRFAPIGALMPDGTKGMGDAPTMFSIGVGSVNESLNAGDTSGLALELANGAGPASSAGVETPEDPSRCAFAFASFWA